jgi:hypothetical protein
MAGNKLFDYDEFDSATQDFLRSKLTKIQSFMKLDFKKDCSALYKIGKQLSEVQAKLVIKDCFSRWLNNNFLNLEEFGRDKPRQQTAYDYMKLYNYVSEFLENADCLKANRTAPSVFYRLGEKEIPNSFKQEFAARINSGDKILEREVKEAVQERPKKVKEGNSNKGNLNNGS